MPGGDALVTERDTGRLLRVDASGGIEEVGAPVRAALVKPRVRPVAERQHVGDTRFVELDPDAFDFLMDLLELRGAAHRRAGRIQVERLTELLAAGPEALRGGK